MMYYLIRNRKRPTVDGGYLEYTWTIVYYDYTLRTFVTSYVLRTDTRYVSTTPWVLEIYRQNIFHRRVSFCDLEAASIYVAGRIKAHTGGYLEVTGQVLENDW